MKTINSLDRAVLYSFEYLSRTGRIVKSDKWQGIKAPAPMFEAMDLSFRAPIPTHEDHLAYFLLPNLPWAENHFQERVGGIPLNPPPSHEEWPFGQKNNEKFGGNDKFDHTYPERFWPKHAGKDPLWWASEDPNIVPPIPGIRFEYGDLSDVLTQLKEDKHTRQAYLPIFFPEDTGAKGGKGRVPCTLGYHFMIREGYLHIGYTMRSCDAFRHFQDDLYMAGRLAQWVIDQLPMYKLKPGMLTFLAYSYHIFESEQQLLDKKIIEWNDRVGN